MIHLEEDGDCEKVMKKEKVSQEEICFHCCGLADDFERHYYVIFTVFCILICDSSYEVYMLYLFQLIVTPFFSVLGNWGDIFF